MARKKQPVGSEYVLFDVVYEDGTRASNRKVPSDAVGGLDGGDVELHRPDLRRHRPGAELDCAPIRLGGVAHAERHGANRGPVDAGEGLRETVGLGIEHEVDVALAIERHVLRAVARRRAESHHLEEPGKRCGIGRRVFDELEPVGAHWIVPQAGARFRRDTGCRAHAGLPGMA